VSSRLRWSERLDARGRAHWSRHLEANGIARSTAQEVITQDLGAKIGADQLIAGLNLIDVIIDGKQVRYSAYLFPDGTVNVGRSIVLT
jgi:hypothetical protein